MGVREQTIVIQVAVCFPYILWKGKSRIYICLANAVYYKVELTCRALDGTF
jgi:hypothetical protein